MRHTTALVLLLACVSMVGTRSVMGSTPAEQALALAAIAENTEAANSERRAALDLMPVRHRDPVSA